MADFLKAYKLTMHEEGLYSNDPLDPGGETFKGISRKYHPSWHGWCSIDAMRRESDNFPDCLKDDEELELCVQEFYKEQFWNVFLGDNLAPQVLADELFDTAVNMGSIRAISFLQTALNVMNRNGELYPDIVVDGLFGEVTLGSLVKYFYRDHVNILLKIMNILQGMHYLENMNKSPTQERFARGWLKRVKFIKG